MAYTYVTFGQVHRHIIGDQIFNVDCVARIECANEEEGRDKAFELFGRKFCFEYHEARFDHEEQMKYFPRGIIDVPTEEEDG